MNPRELGDRSRGVEEEEDWVNVLELEEESMAEREEGFSFAEYGTRG